MHSSPMKSQQEIKLLSGLSIANKRWTPYTVTVSDSSDALDMRHVNAETTVSDTSSAFLLDVNSLSEYLSAFHTQSLSPSIFLCLFRSSKRSSYWNNERVGNESVIIPLFRSYTYTERGERAVSILIYSILYSFS